MIDLNSKLNKINEASHMSFMDETKLEENVPSNDQVNINPTLQVEANCKQACCSWSQVGSKCTFMDEVNSNLTSWIEANHMLFVAWNRIENEHASDNQCESNLANWSKLQASMRSLIDFDSNPT